MDSGQSRCNVVSGQWSVQSTTYGVQARIRSRGADGMAYSTLCTCTPYYPLRSLSLLSPLLRKNRLPAVRPDRHDFHRPAQQFADPLDILSRSGRQVVEASGAGNVLLPAGQRFIHRHDAPQIVHVAGKIGDPPAVQFVGRADFQLRQLVQHVQQHHAPASPRR